MKITKLLLLLLAVFAFSCSDDDDEPALEKKTLSFAEKTEVISAPAAMQASVDPMAEMAVNWITTANAMTGALAYMQIPEGASKSSAQITASNGRVKDDGDYVVYTWHDEQSDWSIGYQIRETSDSYVFEVFLMLPDTDKWLKYFEAEEKKDRSSGHMKMFNIFGDDASVVWYSYEWSRSADILSLTVTVFDSERIELAINEKTKAGSVVYLSNGVKQYEMNWDAQGNGDWTNYDEQGEVVESGSWDV
jgi:hypothetical protein